MMSRCSMVSRFFGGQHHLLMLSQVADTVDGGHGGDDNHVVARHQVLGGGRRIMLRSVTFFSLSFSMNRSRLGTWALGLVMVVLGDEYSTAFSGKTRAFRHKSWAARGFCCAMMMWVGPLGDDVRHGVGLR